MLGRSPTVNPLVSRMTRRRPQSPFPVERDFGTGLARVRLLAVFSDTRTVLVNLPWLWYSDTIYLSLWCSRACPVQRLLGAC